MRAPRARAAPAAASSRPSKPAPPVVAAPPSSRADDEGGEESDSSDGSVDAGGNVIIRKVVKPHGEPAVSLARSVEVASLDYTAVTSATPIDARATLALRPMRMGRKTRMFIVITA